MSNIYEYFNCTSKEELYEKVRNEDPSVQSINDCISFEKGNDIFQKNTAITSPDIVAEYIPRYIINLSLGIFFIMLKKNVCSINLYKQTFFFSEGARTMKKTWKYEMDSDNVARAFGENSGVKEEQYNDKKIDLSE